MNMIKITITIFILLFFNSCTFREMGENIESIYTKTDTIKPYRDNYQVAKPSKYNPVLYEEGEKNRLKKRREQALKEPDTILEGYITQKSYDTDVDLHVYTFLENITNNYHIFYYDKSLPYTKNDLVKVKIADNFLKKIKKYHAEDQKEEDLSKIKYDKFRRIRRMQDNRAAYEETLQRK